MHSLNGWEQLYRTQDKLPHGENMAKKTAKTILVTGATGHQGGAAMRHLKERGFDIRALTRDTEKPAARQIAGGRTEVVRGDLDDPASLGRAMEGVYGVYSVQDSTKGAETEIRQGRNLSDIANRMRVSHLVYSSVASADRNTGIPHFESKSQIEEHVRRTGLRFTIFRPTFFMENLLAMKPAVNDGVIRMPLSPETRLQMIAVDDIGAFATLAFEHPGHWEGRAFELAGDELSMQEIAVALSRVTGKTIQYTQAPWSEFEQAAGKEIADMFRWFEREGYHVDISQVRQERPQLMTFDRWLDLHWAKAATGKVSAA